MEQAAQAMLEAGQGVEAIEAFAAAARKADEEFDPAEDGDIVYSASSPDDKALVEGAARLGFVFLGRSEGMVITRILGTVKRFEALCVIPFNSDRKRMSVVAKQIVPEVAAATRVVTALYAQATGKVDFDAATQASLIDPALPSFSAPYTAALLRERELLGDPSIAKPPRILSKGADSIMCARPMPLFALSTPPQPPPAVFSVPSAAQNCCPAMCCGVRRPLLHVPDAAAAAQIDQSWAVMQKFARVGLRTLVEPLPLPVPQTAARPPTHALPRDVPLQDSRAVGLWRWEPCLTARCANAQVVGSRSFPTPTDSSDPQAFDFAGAWMRSLKDANGMDSGPAQKAELERLHAQVECQLTMHGVTAIEDKLQEGITKVLPTLSKAGIKIWVLTGDKTDTAIEIGFSCVQRPLVGGDNNALG
jgi:magnesium-transporting ATPase (P-type)